ncbi:MAG: HD domain-containing phosphohydrolase [Desulfobacterales bacterium]
MAEEGFIRARTSQLHYYRVVPLYQQTNADKFVLYKPSGRTLSELRVASGNHPDPLFIHRGDKLDGIQEAQRAFNAQLQQHISSQNSEKVRETVAHIVEETLAEPRSGSLEGVSATVGILVRSYTKDLKILKNLVDVSASDYTTVMHSINVMALVLAYADTAGYTPARKKVLGVSALLHDVGKTKIDPQTLKAERRLSDEEFKEMKRHTLLGYHILNGCRFADPEIKATALQHHEKHDGSGYPNGLEYISETAQIVGLIDCYEALTNDDRPYRNALAPLKALELLRDDVLNGKFDPAIFANLAQSLVNMYNP